MPAMHISRSIVIDSTLNEVFETLKTMKKWPVWSPWLIAEPDCPLTYSDDGKSYAWDGKYIGSGSMTLGGEKPDEALFFDLQFVKPWKSHANVRFELEPADGAGTKLTWLMDSSLPFFMFFMKGMMEALLGMDYQRGLLMLKDLLETGSVPADLKFGETTAGPFSIAGIRRDCSVEEMPDMMGDDAEKAAKWMAAADADPAGKMMTVYHKWDPKKGRVSYTIGFPMVTLPEDLPDGMSTFDVPELSTATAQLTGPYHHLANAWSAGIMRGRGGAFKQNKKMAPFEIYENSPHDVAQNDLVTTVHFPLK